MTLNISTKIYWWLIVAYALLAATNVFLPQGDIIGKVQLPAHPAIMVIIIFLGVLIVYGGLGFLGLKLAKKLGWPDIWDEKISNKQRLVKPGLVGAGVGIILIISDLIFSKFNGLGRFPHPPFPTSIIASLSAGIGEEVIFRLFFICFWVWLISQIILKNKKQNLVFWIVSIASALAFAAGHLPSIQMLLGLPSINQIPAILMIEVFLLNGLLSILAAYNFRKYGFLAAVSIHFWADIVWHVIYGLF